MSKQIDCTWDFVVKAPGGKEEKSIVSLKSDGETLTWKSKTTKPMKLTLKYTATVDDNNHMSGFIKVAMAKLKFTGTPIQA